jgi:predicted phage tail protein
VFTTTPEAQAVWVVESDSLYAQQYRVVSVTENDDGTFTIVGAAHDPDKYARIDTGAIIDQRPVSVIPPGNQSAPSNIVISSYAVVNQGISLETMRVSWDQAPNAISYEAQWRRNDGDWVNVPAALPRRLRCRPSTPDVISRGCGLLTRLKFPPAGDIQPRQH